jgi:N6-L-threonylcarbamoyladenine synthase
MQHREFGTSSKIAGYFTYCRYYSNKDTITVLGIETSCDDTGCAVVDSNGKVLGEAMNSQQQVHLK